MTDDLSAPGRAWVRPGALVLLARVDTVVFDVDGVLLDTSASYPRVIEEAARFYFTHILRWPGRGDPIRAEQVPLLKRAGGFNSDWDVTAAVILFYLAKAARLGAVDLGALVAAPPTLPEFAEVVARAGGGLSGAVEVALAGLPDALRAGVLADWDRALIDRICCEFYGGEDGCEPMFGFRPRYVRGPGLYRAERAQLGPDPLLSSGLRLGLYTGRVMGEALFGLEQAGLAGVFAPEAIAASDGPYRKPDPQGLVHLARVLGSRCGLFLGDNVDDALTVRRYREEHPAGAPPFLFAGITGGVLGDRAGAIFREMGADVIAPEPGAVLDLLARARQDGGSPAGNC